MVALQLWPTPARSWLICPRPRCVGSGNSGVTYLRTFHPRLGIPWQTAFGSQNPDDVLAICARRGTSACWIRRDVLQTRQTRPAVIRSPSNGDELFFNQVLAHHPRSLPGEVREVLTDLVGADLLPKQVRFGNDEVVDDEIVDEIAAAYAGGGNEARSLAAGRRVGRRQHEDGARP